jgi:Flp pilus assembly protein TadG
MRVQCRRSERGAELVEFALVLPLLLVVFAAIVDFGFLFQRFEVVTNAAREGARIASLPGYTEADVELRVGQYLNEGLGAGSAARAITTTTDATIVVATGPAIQARQVVVQYTDTYTILGPVISLIGGTGLGTLTLTGRATMRAEVQGP